MIAVIQRVKNASVTIDNKLKSSIDKGLLILLGVKNTDSQKDVLLLVNKISKLRIFSDENDKMNLSVIDVCGEVLVVPNFTLLADYKKGNRPNYMYSAEPVLAKSLYELFSEEFSKIVPTKTGEFGADMKVNLLNDGPVTLVLDSEILK